MRLAPGSRPDDSAAARQAASAIKVVLLVGFMGAGKTSVGRALSGRLGWKFEDLDDRIRAREGRSIEDIFRDSGETEFRQAEHAALRELLGEQYEFPRIVALGGGAFAQTENAALIVAAGVPTVFLEAPVEELYQRCQQEGRERPLHRDAASFRALYEQRRASYAAAKVHIATLGKKIDAVAAEVACSLGLD